METPITTLSACAKAQVEATTAQDTSNLRTIDFMGFLL
jgi:hypothetical protein